MKSTIKILGIIAIVVVIGFSLAACGGTSSPAGTGLPGLPGPPGPPGAGVHGNGVHGGGVHGGGVHAGGSGGISGFHATGLFVYLR